MIPARNARTLEAIVIPRSRSRLMLSSARSWGMSAPHWRSRRSMSVVLPWSTCAITARIQRPSRRRQIGGGGGRRGCREGASVRVGFEGGGVNGRCGGRGERFSGGGPDRAKQWTGHFRWRNGLICTIWLGFTGFWASTSVAWRVRARPN